MTEPVAYPTPQHERLAVLIGDWAGTVLGRFGPDDEWEDYPASATMRWVAERNFVQHEYEGTFAGEPANGTALYGFDEQKGLHTSAWVDSFHTSTTLMVSEGAPNPDAILDVLSHYGDEAGGRWGWRTVVTAPAPDELLIQAFNIPPGGEGYVVLETSLKRQA